MKIEKTKLDLFIRITIILVIAAIALMASNDVFETENNILGKTGTIILLLTIPLGLFCAIASLLIKQNYLTWIIFLILSSITLFGLYQMINFSLRIVGG
jgi:hypothetical protein